MFGKVIIREAQAFGFFIDHGKLQSVLRQALETTNIQQEFESEISSISREPGKVELGLKSGESISTSLLVVAEGSGSSLAKELGISRQGWSHNQRALVTNVKRKGLLRSNPQ